MTEETYAPNYYFVDKEDIAFQCTLSSLQDNYENVYRHFMEYEDEVCYVLNEDEIFGIISIGDLYRFYRGEKSTPVNQKFSYVQEINFKEAENIFAKIGTIHEVPVICNGKLLGCIRNGKQQSEDDWMWARYSIRRGFSGEYRWFKDKANEILGKLKARLYIYAYPEEKEIIKRLSQKEIALYKKKKKYPHGPSGILMMSKEEQEHFFGGGKKKYTEEYVKEFCNDYNEIAGKLENGIYKIKDMSSTYFSFSNGYRSVPNAPEKATKHVYIFGPCMAVGGYVSDNDTIATYLQRLLLDAGYDEYDVVNCGLFGPRYVYGRILTEEISEDDIVIVLDNYLGEKNNIRRALTEVYLTLENPIDNIFNAFMHCNYRVNEKIAEKFFADISSDLIKNHNSVVSRVAIQDYYIPWDIVSYFREYFIEHKLKKDENQCVGAIVMNCNPFTKGHRYLIEQASSRVDLLYVFVVEEDKSVFKFVDRIEMVKLGTLDLENVKVLPSGKYIISKETFAQYFEKDAVEQVEDMEYDVRIFGEVVASELGITVRFVGEEPFDKVTKKYNQTMHRILPEYGVEVKEIPRISASDGRIISASAVRKAMTERNKEVLENMLPESTIEYLNL